MLKGQSTCILEAGGEASWSDGHSLKEDNIHGSRKYCSTVITLYNVSIFSGLCSEGEPRKPGGC